MKQGCLLTRSIRLDRLFEQYRENPALVTSDGTLSFGNVEERLRRVAANLSAAGVRKRNRVAIHGANSELHLYLLLASWLMDFLYIPLDFKAPLASLLTGTEIDFLVTDAQAPAAAKYVVIGPQPVMNLCCRANQNITWPAVPFDQEASAIFTSGSTGRPRGIVHTVGNCIYSARGTNEFIGLNASDRWLLSLPLFHVGGALIWVRTLLSGSACIMPDSRQNLEACIRQHRPTVISVVPTQLIRLLEQKDLITVLKHMKTIMLGGAPAPAWLLEKSLDRGLPVMPTYGCTESCAQATGVPQGSDRTAYFTAGRAVPYRDIRIAKDGRILLGGKTLFKRYLDEQQAPPFDQDGFFKTADSGSMDKKGNLTVSGRTDGVFISGGENISPLEIEKQLLRQDGVITAIVVPAPHREFGMTPWAFIEATAPFDEKNTLDRLRRGLPGYKLPKRIIRLLPEDRKGKMKYSREALTELARTLAGDQEAVSPSGKHQQKGHSRAGGNQEIVQNPGFRIALPMSGMTKNESRRNLRSGGMKNTQLHYEENGSSDAPVIVFLHGFMGQAASWRPIMESLADSFRVIAFDLPGHGASLFSKSKRLKKLRDMDDTAGLLLEDLDALKISRFTLYGYSMGGRLAQHVAIASPGRIKNLILESASFGIDDPVEKEERRKRDEALMAGIRTRKAFLAFLKNWYSMPLFRTLHGTPQIMNLISEKMNHPFAEFRQALSILSVGRHSFLAGQLAKCFLPVYYFCGKQDLAYIETARQVKTWLPEMRITIFKNASHNISIQYPQEISRAIRRILI